MDDKERDQRTGPGEAVEKTMPDIEELPGDARDRDDDDDAPRKREPGDPNAG